MIRGALLPAVAVALLLSAAAAQHVVPPAADSAPAGTAPTGKFDFQQLGQCTADSGLTARIDQCQGSLALHTPGESKWYRFNVIQEQAAFSFHMLARVQNGRIRMGLWLPGQSLDTPPSYVPDNLLTSQFAQEMFITLPASTLYHNPGIYMLQIVSEYGAPQVTLTADVTSGATLLAVEDRQAVQQIVQDCCASTEGMVCSMLTAGINADSMETDLCHQGAVQCDRDGHITDFVLQGTNTEMDLTCPTFSAGFAALPRLVRLDLAGANLGATTEVVGKALAPATQLRWLVLRTSGLQGTISCDILLPSLHLLSLSSNSLTGVVPECLTQTRTLRHLYLSMNSLSGPLPDFSPDTSLQLMFARDQAINGEPSLLSPLPASVARAKNLQYLQLSNTGLTGMLGDLPPGIRYLNVSNNALEGPLPNLPTSLISLDVAQNRISGGLPADMSGFANLVDIQAYTNELEGPLPSKMPPSLIQLAVAGNGFIGTLPPLPRGIKYLSVAQNNMEGPLPSGPAASGIWFADLSSNSFSGLLPSSLSQSAELVYLNVSNNQLSGIESPEAWSTPNCVTLDASNNAMQGAIPIALAQQENMAYINLAANSFSGNLEGFAKALTRDWATGAVFDVSHNQLTGALPEQLGSLAVFSSSPTSFPSWSEIDTTGYPIKVFSVANNNLNGPFPEFLITGLGGLVTSQCEESDTCNLFVRVNGGNNRLTCPAPLSASSAGADDLPPDHLQLLQKQELGCIGKDGRTYEVASVLLGKPVAIKVAEVPKPAGNKRPDDATATRAAALPAAAAAAAAQQQQQQQPAARQHEGRGKLAPGAIAGIVAGAVAAAAIVAVLGYIVVYRRWYTVRAAQSFRKMHEGALAAAGGATINSSAPNAGHMLPAPPGVIPGAVGGDDRV